MNKFMNKLEKAIIDLDCGSNELNSNLQSLILSNGKRIRPKLAYLLISMHEEVSSSEQDNLIIAGELLHTASLIHDDIIDEARERRGEKALYLTFDSKLAVLAGDLLASFAMDMICDIRNWDVVDLFQKTFQKMCNAEIKQYCLRGDIPSVEEYLDKSKGKTGMLFAAIFSGVAILSKTIDRDLMYEFGLSFGTVFQIKNDLKSFLDKENSNDRKNGVLTLPDIYFKQCDSELLAIEKTKDFIDNEKKKMYLMLSKFSDNKYRQEIVRIIEEL